MRAGHREIAHGNDSETEDLLAVGSFVSLASNAGVRVATE